MVVNMKHFLSYFHIQAPKGIMGIDLGIPTSIFFLSFRALGPFA